MLKATRELACIFFRATEEIDGPSTAEFMCGMNILKWWRKCRKHLETQFETEPWPTDKDTELERKKSVLRNGLIRLLYPEHLKPKTKTDPTYEKTYKERKWW